MLSRYIFENFFPFYPIFIALLPCRDYQEWILKIIRDGMRSEQDWITAQRCFLFKLLLQYYSSASSNEGTNVKKTKTTVVFVSLLLILL